MWNPTETQKATSAWSKPSVGLHLYLSVLWLDFKKKEIPSAKNVSFLNSHFNTYLFHFYSILPMGPKCIILVVLTETWLPVSPCPCASQMGG